MGLWSKAYLHCVLLFASHYACPALRSAAGETLCLNALLEDAVRLSGLLEWIVMRTLAGN
jgi:hypothetical protein